ncbi:MAG: hypothetical protein ACPH7I_03680, partial [Flavobacteriaceae bacterium]
SRFPFAMARDGALPSVFTSISKQYMTPVFSMVIHSPLTSDQFILLLPKSVDQLLDTLQELLE